MKTGLTKSQKTTEIWFDEKEPLIHIRTQYLGPDEMLVGAKIALTPELDLAGVAATIDVAATRMVLSQLDGQDYRAPVILRPRLVIRGSA